MCGIYTTDLIMHSMGVFKSIFLLCVWTLIIFLIAFYLAVDFFYEDRKSVCFTSVKLLFSSKQYRTGFHIL